MCRGLLAGVALAQKVAIQRQAEARSWGVRKLNFILSEIGSLWKVLNREKCF